MFMMLLSPIDTAHVPYGLSYSAGWPSVRERPQKTDMGFPQWGLFIVVLVMDVTVVILICTVKGRGGAANFSGRFF